jgi:secondary thiamine-phosphate synthase enzyme
METVRIDTGSRSELVDVTARVREAVRESGVREGLCVVYVPHTTAGVCINESADPDVARDVEDVLERLVPPGAGYRHAEGNADSHAKAILVGSSVQLVVEDGEPRLGRWQGIFFCEFDGPRRGRQIWVRVLAGG